MSVLTGHYLFTTSDLFNSVNMSRHADDFKSLLPLIICIHVLFFFIATRLTFKANTVTYTPTR